MSHAPVMKKSSGLVKDTYWFGIAGLWTLLVCGLCAYAVIQSKHGITEHALLEAKTNIDKDLAYRKWVSEQGGVYVTPTGKTPPNPYLQVPARDVVTTEGMKLTLINPAYMTRQVHESAATLYGLRGHLTSLKPIRPENRPDAWEEAALNEIEKGVKEVTAPAVEMEGKWYLRQMRGFVTEKSCLKCHAVQGYSEGDVRGGISVSVPLEHYYAIYRADRNGTLIRYLIVWAIGICGILILRNNLKRSSAYLQASEHELKEKEFFFRASQQAAMVGSYMLDFAAGVWESSETLDNIFGIDQNHAKDIQGWLEIVHPDDRDMMGRYLNDQVLSHNQPFDRDYRIIRKNDGALRWVMGRGKLRFDANGTPVAMAGTIQDITERKQAEQQLRQSHDLMSYIIKHNPSALAVHDKALRYLFVSERYLDDYKVKDRDIIGRHHYDVFPDLPQKWRDIHQKALAGITSRAENDRYDKEDGTTEWTTWECRPWYEANGEVGGFVLYTEVVTERINAEEQKLLLQQQLHQAQKMESVGRLAGGVAHDFNNILTVIGGYSSLLQMDSSLNPEQKIRVGAIVSSAEKAAQLTHGLLAFSRKQPMVMRQEDLNGVIQHIHNFLARIIGEDITIRMECSGIILPVHIDRGQMEQVLINLATNARDAMQKGGLFTVRSELVALDAPVPDFNHFDIPPGKYALLTVSDTGTGISKECLDHIFEPFFTTKEVGKGTGLGMAIIYGIIKQHNGFINVCSEVGTGTSVRIYLPIQERREEHLTDMTEEVSPTKGSEAILVAEDDPSVRTLVSEVLKSYGYEVILAQNGLNAIEEFRRHEDRIRLVLLDMIMPKKNGREAYEEIRHLNPGVKVLFFSGYTADFIESRGVTEDGIELIMKPISPTELLKKVRSILDA